MVVVIIASDSEIMRTAFETSAIASHLRAIGVNYQFMTVDGGGDEFDGPRWAQPFTASGGLFAAMQRISAVRGKYYEHTDYEHTDYEGRHYDESGMLLGVSRKQPCVFKDDRVVIAIESYITENNKDCVCIVVNYYVDGEKRELVSFSPASYIASFPDKYLQHLAKVENYKPGDIGFKTTIGDIIELEKHIHGGGVSKNWHKLFNPFDRVEQIRETLNYIADEFKKNVIVPGILE